MPAILTHDFFGRDLLDADDGLAYTVDERDAFLLGSQGPDPLFFLAIHPTLRQWRDLGGRMHKERTAEVAAAFSQAAAMFDGQEAGVGLAYAKGFLCHHALDSLVHPLVYSIQYRVCDAGVEGLSRENGSEVHAEIEREIDEMMLTVKRGQTVRDYPAADNTLDASQTVLACVQKMYAFCALSVFGLQVPSSLFPAAVGCYRATLAAMHSPFGVKRALAAAAEGAVRPYSLFAAMAHKPVKVEESWFANAGHEEWENPFTGQVRDASFFDLYQEAADSARQSAALLDQGPCKPEEARAMTHDVNFSGEPTAATLVVEG